MDVIFVGKNIIDSLIEWVQKYDNHFVRMVFTVLHHLPFPEIEIEYENTCKMCFIVKPFNELPSLEVRAVFKERYIIEFNVVFKYTPDEVFVSPGNVKIEDDALKFFRLFLGNRPTDKVIAMTTRWIVDVYILIMLYIGENEDTEYIQVKTLRSKHTKKPRKKTGKKRVTYINHKVYVLSPPPPDNEKRDYTRHMYSWTVRGHWRTYKNGKKVWIRPYIKGDGTVEPKKYKLGI